jgi:hypothetical protein
MSKKNNFKKWFNSLWKIFWGAQSICHLNPVMPRNNATDLLTPDSNETDFITLVTNGIWFPKFSKLYAILMELMGYFPYTKGITSY